VAKNKVHDWVAIRETRKKKQGVRNKDIKKNKKGERKK
jgi:hypothetical protein